MRLSPRAAALMLVLGLSATAHAQKKSGDAFEDTLATAKKEKKFVLVSFEKPG